MTFSFVGIDPGVSGAIAVIHQESTTAVLQESTTAVLHQESTTAVIREDDRVISLRTYELVEDTGRLLEIFNWLSTSDLFVLEKVTGYIPKTGDRKHGGQPGSHMFELGKSYGICLGLLAGTGVVSRLILSAPVTWQKGLGLRLPTGLTYEQRKKELHSYARRLVPDTLITKQCADACLLALYAQKLYHQIHSTETNNHAHRARS